MSSRPGFPRAPTASLVVLIGLLLTALTAPSHAEEAGSPEVVWHTPHPSCNDRPGCSPAQSAAVTAIPGVFSGGLDGHLRAYAAKTGAIIWDVDTIRDYQAVNGAAARGGSLDGPGAVVAGGMLYVNSGYTKFGTTPGNVLLAFSVEGQ